MSFIFHNDIVSIPKETEDTRGDRLGIIVPY